MMSTLVNGGHRVTPRVLEAFNDGRGVAAGTGGAHQPAPCCARPETLAIVERGLWKVVNGAAARDDGGGSPAGT